MLGQTISRDGLDYLPCSLLQPNTANRCNNPEDANWTSPFAFGSWAWEGSLLGAPLSGPGLSLIDATYSYGFGRLRGMLPPDTTGGFPERLLLLERLQRSQRRGRPGQHATTATRGSWTTSS